MIEFFFQTALLFTSHQNQNATQSSWLHIHLSPNCSAEFRNMSLHGAKLNRDPRRASPEKWQQIYIVFNSLSLLLFCIKRAPLKNIEQLVREGNKISCCSSAFHIRHREEYTFSFQRAHARPAMSGSVKKNNRKEYVIQICTPTPPRALSQIEMFSMFCDRQTASQPANNDSSVGAHSIKQR